MALKEILVHLDASPATEPRLKAALSLAERHNAHVTGLYVVNHAKIPDYARTQIPASVFEAQRKVDLELADEAKSVFDRITENAGVSHEYRRVEGEITESLIEHGRYADLTVVGQKDAENEHNPSDLPDRLVLSLGRPVLVVPKKGEFNKVGSVVSVGWDASRLATRAIGDAMPVLEKSDSVFVLGVTKDKNGNDEISGMDITHHLARHDIKAECRIENDTCGTAGEGLLKAAETVGADMLVMGAYGHNRWRELVLGGATKFILDNMTMPVLLSH